MRASLYWAAVALLLTACGAPKESPVGRHLDIVAATATKATPVVRRGFVGAFFRPEGPPPFGVFSVYSKQEAPVPNPAPTTKLFGPRGYCDAVALNGLSISSGYAVDKKKLADIVDLGVRWARTTPASFFDDRSHVDPAEPYLFADFDSAQCALVRHGITPLIALEAGPVQYNINFGHFSPRSETHYKTAADFGQWCGTVARHDRRIFTSVHRYSMPGNEVNGNAEMFPGGEAQIAAYTEACFRAVKRADPMAFVYGFELNMDKNADAAGFVQRLYDLGCRPGVCYDGISMHLSLRYPIPAATTPCHPHPNGDYSLHCIDDVRTAAHAPVHVIIGETGYFVPSSIRDEAMKAQAVVAAFQAFAALDYVDGVNYANVDECDLYPSGYFVGGCLVDSIGTKLPAYVALQRLAAGFY